MLSLILLLVSLFNLPILPASWASKCPRLHTLRSARRPRGVRTSGASQFKRTGEST